VTDHETLQELKAAGTEVVNHRTCEEPKNHSYSSCVAELGTPKPPKNCHGMAGSCGILACDLPSQALCGDSTVVCISLTDTALIEQRPMTSCSMQETFAICELWWSCLADHHWNVIIAKCFLLAIGIDKFQS
jgi:hypothetical protein